MSAATPKVSIITPSLNQGEFIETTLRSVAAQDYPNMEYIVVDGGSIDNSVEIINRYSSGIDSFIHEPDRGQTHAINKGFGEASGDILAWINSDDYYFPNIVSKVVRAFQDDPELDLLYGDAVFVGRNSQFIRYFVEVQPFSAELLLNYSDYIMQPTAFFRRRLAEKIGFLREDLQFGMDWDFWCRLVQAGAKFRYEPTLIAANRVYPATKTLSGGKERLHELMQINMKHKTSLIPWGGLSYWAGEIVRILGGGSTNSHFFRLIRRGKRWLRKERKRHLYGVEGHGPRLKKEFAISLPWYNSQPRSAEVCVIFQGGGQVRLVLSAGGDEHKVCATIPAHQPVTLTVPFPKDQAFGLRVDIRGRWQPIRAGDGKMILRSVRIQTRNHERKQNAG